MRVILLSLFLSACAFGGFGLKAQEVPGIPEQAFATLWERGEVIIEFHCEDSSRVKRISSFLSIDRRTPGSGYVAYANEAGFRKFLAYQLPFRLVEPRSLEKSSAAATDFPGNWDVYPSYSQYVDFMNAMAGSHTAICRLDTLGLSVDGRLILAAKITDHPEKREPEPAFAYSSTMHGDETAGFVLLLRLIDHLCSGYGQDSLVTRLVDNVEIWINPLANPDGTYLEGDDISLPKRTNSNNVDLNRNFPGLNDPGHPDGNPYQPENLAQIHFLRNIYQVMGANIHGGMEVVNYPFDTWDTLHADDAWYRSTSREYADLARQRAYPLLYMIDLDSGITNGWEWYKAEGSRQDWVNYYNHAREVTLEISRDKIPPASDLPYYWYYNYASMLRYMEQSLLGIQGTVKDGSTGQALKATVRVGGHDRLNSEIYSDSITGYFARPIEPGTWDLEITVPGYETAFLSGVQVEAGRATRLEALLYPLATGSGNFTGIRVSPNPFLNRTEIVITAIKPGHHTLLLFDLNGKLVHRADLSCPAAGEYVYCLDGGPLEAGIYLLKLITPSGIRSVKIFRSEWK